MQDSMIKAWKKAGFNQIWDVELREHALAAATYSECQLKARAKSFLHEAHVLSFWDDLFIVDDIKGASEADPDPKDAEKEQGSKEEEHDFKATLYDEEDFNG